MGHSSCRNYWQLTSFPHDRGPWARYPFAEESMWGIIAQCFSQWVQSRCRWSWRKGFLTLSRNCCCFVLSRGCGIRERLISAQVLPSHNSKLRHYVHFAWVNSRAIWWLRSINGCFVPNQPWGPLSLASRCLGISMFRSRSSFTGIVLQLCGSGFGVLRFNVRGLIFNLRVVRF